MRVAHSSQLGSLSREALPRVSKCLPPPSAVSVGVVWLSSDIARVLQVPSWAVARALWMPFEHSQPRQPSTPRGSKSTDCSTCQVLWRHCLVEIFGRPAPAISGSNAIQAFISAVQRAGKTGRGAGHALGALGLFFSSFESAIAYGSDRILPDELNTIAAGGQPRLDSAGGTGLRLCCIVLGGVYTHNLSSLN